MSTEMHKAHDHSKLLCLLSSGDQWAFEVIYDRFADRLYRYIYSRTRVKETSEEILQEIFVSLWARRESLEITTSLDSYLFGTAKHKILSHFRSEGVRKKYAAELALFAAERVDNSSEELLEEKDLEQTIKERISELPEKCQTVFLLSRVEHQPIKHIAERLNISHRTVENYICQALKHLKVSLGEFLVLSILFAA